MKAAHRDAAWGRFPLAASAAIAVVASAMGSAACSGAATPPPVEPTPVSSVIASPPAGTLGPGGLVIPPPLAEPLPEIDRKFVELPLPGVEGGLVSVAGRGANDVWFLSNEAVAVAGHEESGVTYQYDGKAVTSRGHPCDMAEFGSLVASKDEVSAHGYMAWTRGTWPNFEATIRTGDKEWSCGRLAYRVGFASSTGDHVWLFSCDTETCSLAASGGLQAASLPAFDGSDEGHNPLDLPATLVAMRGEDDGWMVLEGADERGVLLRYNGVSWATKAVIGPDLEIADMWVDEASNVWLLGAARGGKKASPSAGTVLRFDGKALSALAVPASFAAREVRGTGARDVWFVGAGNTVYQWDGERLREGRAPFDVADAWAAPGGELWIVGAAAGAGGSSTGLAAHTSRQSASPKEAKP